MSPFLRFSEKILNTFFLKLTSREADEPIRAELFSIERLEQHAESLAQAQSVTRKFSRGRRFLGRVIENAKVLTAAHHNITQTIREERTITPAAEWLVDNFHIVEEQILEIIDDLPPEFYWKLPKLKDGFLKGNPRVYGLAWAFVAHTDSRFDPDWLRRFVHAYQKIDPLTIGEVWALAISLRIVLVENLRRLAECLTDSKSGQLKADFLADSLLGLKGLDPADSVKLLKNFESIPLKKSFAVQLVLRLRDQGEEVAPVLQWLDKRLEAQGTTAEDLVRLEHQEQTAMNTTVRNVITSMRLVSGLDWSQFFEDVSPIDELLRNAGNFAAMDFPTRDMYRHAIEELAEGSRLSEIEVTRRLIQTAQSARALGKKIASPSDEIEFERKSDPGYYLVSKGRLLFEKQINCKISFKRRFFRAYVAGATATYLGTVAFMTCVILAIPFYYSFAHGMSLLAFIAFAVAGYIPASDLAVALVNRFVTKSMGPRSLPKLDFSKGIPPHFRTLVAMPAMLSNAIIIQENLERLEIHYLSNPDGYLQFALLTDWTDSQQEHTPNDELLLAAAQEGISKLNERYGKGPEMSTRFFLFHRRRLWNAQENVWMGWERKRGKLHELNSLLRGSTESTFIPASSNPENIPKKIRYVITLDADTRMSYGVAYRLAGAMAHPLNRPRFDPGSGRVLDGYGIIQPRITPTLPITGDGSLYQRIFSGPAGIDPYAFAVSDVYQDLFREGSYIGKGIYDLDAFESSLNGRVPDNCVLSHDLFEGLHARAALATDIELFEEFPSHYEVAVSRTHRWVRGDWQLLPWIAGRATRADNTPQSKPLPFIGRWKMTDNLRRSLSAPALLLTLLFSWTVTSAPAGVWIIFILAVMGLAPIQPLLSELMPRRKQISIQRHLQSFTADVYSAFLHIFLAIVFLAYQASLMADAISRTLYRLFISHRKMLEWTSAAQAKIRADYKLAGFYKRMASAPVIAILCPIIIFVSQTTERFWMMAPFVILWGISPWIARRISLPIKKSGSAEALAPSDRRYFRMIARKTWHFFETFVNETHHFLPPDNFQEIPEPVVANRTSPTNIGLYLLSVTAARDFGWIGILETVDRLEKSLETVNNLKKFRGHLFNWYDTLSLQPLNPHYVSTVDSGNLAGHLWTVANTCRQLASTPLLRDDILTGFADVLPLILEASLKTGDAHRSETVTGIQLEEALAALKISLLAIPASLSEWRETFSDLKSKSATLVDIAKALEPPNQSENELLKWSELLLQQVGSHAKDFQEVIPQ